MKSIEVDNDVIIRSNDEYNGYIGTVTSMGRGQCGIIVYLNYDGSSQCFEPEEVEVLPRIRGVARYFAVTPGTDQSYLGFGASFVYEAKSIKVVRVGSDDVRWQYERIASGLGVVSLIYPTLQGAFDDPNTIWYVQQQTR